MLVTRPRITCAYVGCSWSPEDLSPAIWEAFFLGYGPDRPLNLDTLPSHICVFILGLFCAPLRLRSTQMGGHLGSSHRTHEAPQTAIGMEELYLEPFKARCFVQVSKCSARGAERLFIRSCQAAPSVAITCDSASNRDRTTLENLGSMLEVACF